MLMMRSAITPLGYQRRLCVFVPWSRSRMSTLSFEEEVGKIEENLAMDKEWSKTPAAKQALAQGKKMPKGGVRGAIKMNMESYLRERGFEDAAKDPSSSAFRTLSAAMTFPLTLGYGVNRIFSYEGPAEQVREMMMEMHSRPLNILVIGARAESSLPALWWRECIASCCPSGAIDGGLHIGLIGPELQPMRANPTTNEINVQLHPPTFAAKQPEPPHATGEEEEKDQKDVRARVYQVPNGLKMLHKHPEHMKLLLHTDLFVLFNPGLGHKALSKDWEETMKLLCMSRKPVLCTAHSLKDLNRDRQFLENLTNATDADEQDLGEPLEFLLEAHENPFASSRRTVDEKEEEEAQIVTTNQYIHAFRGK